VSGGRREVLYWVAQRATAVVLGVCVLVHLATMIYAVRNGLSAAEILGRTRGSLAWGAFYTVFVLAAAIHGAIGLRTIAAEWLSWRGGGAELATSLVGFGLTVAGLRAVAAVVGAPG
jgi:fumarate reductase subunit C